jgi:hypothetical protein
LQLGNQATPDLLVPGWFDLILPPKLFQQMHTAMLLQFFFLSRRLLLIHYQETKTMPLPKFAQVAQNIHNQLVGPIPREMLQLGPGQGIN